jgi:hypothetical protein
METGAIFPQGVIYGFIELIKSRGYIKGEKDIKIYRCFESFNDGIESGTAGISFNKFYLMEISESETTFALLTGKSVVRGRGNIDIMAEMRVFEVTDIWQLCADWKTSKEKMVDVALEILMHKLEVSAAFFTEMEWNFPRDKGVVVRIMSDGGISYKGKNLKRFLSEDKKNWKPEVVDYIADDFINSILDRES